MSALSPLNRNQVFFICSVILLCYLVSRGVGELQKGNEALSLSHTFSNVITHMWKTCCSENIKGSCYFQSDSQPNLFLSAEKQLTELQLITV